MENVGKLSYVLGPIIFVLKVCGSYVEISDTGRVTARTKVHMAYCILINVLCWADVLRFLSAFSIKSVLSTKFMAMTTVALTLVVNVVYMPIYLRVLTRNLPSLIMKFDEYESRYGLTCDPDRLRKRVSFVLAFIFIVTCGGTTLTIVCVINEWVSRDSIVISCLNPFQNFPDYVFIPMTIVIQLRVLIMGLVGTSVAGIYLVILSFLKTEYVIIEKCFERFDHHDLEYSRLRHGNVTQILCAANTILQHCAALQYGISIPASVMILYGLIYGKMAPEDFLLLLYLIALSLIMTFYITYRAAEVNIRVSYILIEKSKYTFLSI